MDPATLAVGTVASCVVTELIRAAINWTKGAKKCKGECTKLHEELVGIAPDVERIEQRLATLRNANRGPVDPQLEDLATVEDWLRQLKNAIVGAKDDVHRCNSGRFSFDQNKLSARLTAHFNTITRLGHQRQILFLFLRNLMDTPAQEAALQHYHHHHQDNWYNSPGQAVLQKMAEEINEAHRLEALTRLSMSSSGHGGGSVHAGYGMDSPRAHLLQQETPRSATVFHQDEQQYSAAHLPRRHTMAAGTTQAQIAKAYGHDSFSASWKY